MGFFGTFATWLNGQLATYIGDNTARLASVLEPAIVTLATIYVMAWGYLHLTGKAPPSNVYQTIIKEAAARGTVVWCGGEGTSARYCSTQHWLGQTLNPKGDNKRLLEIYLAAFGPAPLSEAAAVLGLTQPAMRSF